MQKVVGIDPGKTSGAICIIDEHGQLLHKQTMPPIYQLCDLIEEWIKEYGAIHVYLEKAQTMPKQGGVSVFRYGQHYGNLEGVLIALNIPHTAVHPSTWTRVMHAGCKIADKGREGAKARSMEAARRLWPREDFRASERCKKDHDGIIDAVLISEFGRREVFCKKK